MAATYSSLVGLAVGGKYEIRRVLGAGGMGVVCEAVHQDLGKKVAVKLIDKSMKESELIVARFKREARALGQIQSEHIVDVFDVGADKRVGLYIVMEHLVGEDLQRRLDREKRVDVRTGVMIAHQLSRGLAKAHEAGVVHRDLKPANVFLTTRDNGQMLVKILDFGVSKMLGETGASRITGSGAPIGTPLYMSPEQAEGKDDTDGRADIWSLGAVMYEALSGNTPFNDRGSYHATIVGILTSRPKLMFDAAPHVPKDICSVIDACLVHDRDARIKDAAAFTQRLLEAYPAVMPDGTGRHTAVIIPQANAAVDATGDTEFFTSASIPAASASSRPSRPSKPDSRPASSGPNPISGADALRTAAATPVNLGDRASASPTPVELATYGSFAVSGENASIRTGGPKTEPLWKSPNSSASGVAMPGTPPIIEPLPMSVVPDTTRDTLLAMKAERRRWIAFGAVAAAIIGVALVGFLLGRRSSNPLPAAAPPPVQTVMPSAATPPPPPSVVVEPPKADAPPAPSATVAATVEPPKPKPRIAKPKPAVVAPTEPKPEGVEAPAPKTDVPTE